MALVSAEASAAAPVRPVLGWAVVLAVLLAWPAARLAAGPLGLPLAGDSGLRLLLALVLAPLVEEGVLRTLLQQGLTQWLQRRGWRQRKALAGAALVATGVFALVHLDSFSGAALWHSAAWLAPGAALAAAWCWRQRTLDCVLLHAYFNAALWLTSTAAA